MRGGKEMKGKKGKWEEREGGREGEGKGEGKVVEGSRCEKFL